MEHRILVTGASGRTGRHAAEYLISQGYKVRAFFHSIDARSENLKALGAEIVTGDLLDYPTVNQALKGITTAYFIYPIEPGLIEATTYFAQAARNAGLKGIVNMSQISAREDSESDGARNHWLAERLFDQSGVPVTHLRPTFFADTLTTPLNRKLIQERGVISMPFGQGRHAPIATEDQGRVIASILIDPAPHAGKIYRLCGPVEMDHAGIATEVGAVLGVPVTYESISIDTFRHQLEMSGMSAYRIQHLCAVAHDYRNGLFEGTDDVIEQLTGIPPMTVSQFIRTQASLFNIA